MSTILDITSHYYTYRVKMYTENALSSSSVQSSPSRNTTDNEPVPSAIPVISGRQIPMSKSSRSILVSSSSPMSVVTSTTSGISSRSQNAGMQNTIGIQQIGAQNLQQYPSANNRSNNSGGNHGCGAIPRRNIRKGNNTPEEEIRNDKQ